jgi:hypothetical protein
MQLRQPAATGPLHALRNSSETSPEKAGWCLPDGRWRPAFVVQLIFSILIAGYISGF